MHFKVYFASTSKKTIESVNLNSGSRDILVSDGLDSPEGLAIDWIHRRMYWTDTRCVVLQRTCAHEICSLLYLLMMTIYTSDIRF